MSDWKREIELAQAKPHRFHLVAKMYMRATGSGYGREEFDSLLFKTMLEGVQNFEQIWNVAGSLRDEVSRKSLFTSHLFRRALELADDEDALRAIIFEPTCPKRIRKQAEVKMLNDIVGNFVSLLEKIIGDPDFSTEIRQQAQERLDKIWSARTS